MSNSTKNIFPAVIDIGSNSVRLLIKVNEINQKELNSTVLAQGLAVTNMLSSEAIERTAKAVSQFYNKATDENCSPIYIFATEAVRSASNKEEFLKRVKELCGQSVDVISGVDESLIGFLGACGGKDSECGIFDIGGASVEIATGKLKKISYKKSLPLGMVRLYDIYQNDYKKLEKDLRIRIKEYGKIGSVQELYGIGGTATTIGAMKVCNGVYNAVKVHNTKVSNYDIEDMLKLVMPLNDTELMKTYPFISPNRARVIRHGLVLTRLIMEYVGIESFIASEHDNMEGYIAKKNMDLSV